jgi:prophage antirepressor-like protein
MKFINERGLIEILGKSDKPIAEKFRDWIYDILKSLRLG